MHTRKSEKDSSVDAGTSRGAASSQESESSSTKCCVVLVEKHHGSEFLKMYQNKNWSQPDGGLLPSKVHISSLNVGQVVDDDSRQQGRMQLGKGSITLPRVSHPHFVNRCDSCYYKARLGGLLRLKHVNH